MEASLSYLIPGIRASPHQHKESTPVMFCFSPRLLMCGECLSALAHIPCFLILSPTGPPSDDCSLTKLFSNIWFRFTRPSRPPQLAFILERCPFLSPEVYRFTGISVWSNKSPIKTLGKLTRMKAIGHVLYQVRLREHARSASGKF